MRKWEHMRYRLLACLLALGALANGQVKMSVQQLISFIRNNQQLIKEKKSTDRETADFVSKVKLSEKLDQAVIEDLQGDGVGPITIKALERLKDRTQALAAANIEKALPDDPIPIPTSLEQGKILDEVRDYVLNYDSSLPDFICLEVETRKAAARPGGRYATRAGGEPIFITQDVITSKLTYFKHREEKTPILNGSKPINTAYENLGGSTSTGDFGTMLRTLFLPTSQTRFEWARWATWDKRLTMVFSFHVDQQNSQYSIRVSDLKREIITAYEGELFVDKETRKVMRLVTKAVDIPSDFPVRRADEALTYGYEDVGGTQFLLPTRGEVQMDGTDVLSDNILEFRHYRKYEVGSSISFDLPADINTAGKPEEKESKPIVDCTDPKNKALPACKK
jgi:hypothetical protein